MIILIAGTSHTGKTAAAQKLLEKYKFPYLSLDHLKMGLIRSGMTTLTPEDDDKLIDYLWPVTKEIIKTAIENDQNLIIEGCYIPFDWANHFAADYLTKIKYVCLVMSERYITENFERIIKYANIIEKRLDDSSLTIDALLSHNKKTLNNCLKYNVNCLLIDKDYDVEARLDYLLS